ncbi:(4Fe-4S)-binding protein [candidate division KSB1 bacterium]|nr:ATP-binding protein [candidate division KSB1 bacterium]RQW00320.1 MAG: (4Fe-4S)-binding protein [candidate division KSB1 bacterium]
MTITIASGKGGTGKTTIATNLAVALATEKVQFLDCDVEAPNSHIFLRPAISKTEPVQILVPQVDDQKCTLCGRCAEVCEYHAIGLFGKRVLVFPDLCHACGGCSIACPENAITEVPHDVGLLQTGQSNGIHFFAGQLNIGEAKATPVINAVKRHIRSNWLNIIDAPPGTSCPVVETVRHSDYVLLVTEPTPFGLHDLELAVAVMRKVEVPCGVVLNRADIGDEGVENFCHEKNIDILLRIPHRRDIAEAYATGRLLIEMLPDYRAIFRQLYSDIEGQL